MNTQPCDPGAPLHPPPAPFLFVAVAVPSAHINRHKPWRAPPQTFLTTLLAGIQATTTKKSDSIPRARTKKSLPELFHARSIPRCFPYRACLREEWSVVPGSLCPAWRLFTRSYGDQNYGLSALLLLRSSSALVGVDIFSNRHLTSFACGCSCM